MRGNAPHDKKERAGKGDEKNNTTKKDDTTGKGGKTHEKTSENKPRIMRRMLPRKTKI